MHLIIGTLNILLSFRLSGGENNYQPVSVLPAISELFEKVLFDQLYASFTPILSWNMSGFLKRHSCATALIKLTDDWRSALNEKKDMGAIAIDLSKAFDCLQK